MIIHKTEDEWKELGFAFDDMPLDSLPISLKRNIGTEIPENELITKRKFLGKEIPIVSQENSKKKFYGKELQAKIGIKDNAWMGKF
jgi:hypothetical protein